jgi:hypothetical protein
MTEANWEREYQSLSDFVAAHPEIVIDRSEVSIPSSLRDEFYARFDDIRKAVVNSHYSALPPEIEQLRDNFVQIEGEIMDLLNLERISMPLDLSSFLHNPEEGLIRALYNLTFYLVQGKIQPDEYEKQAEAALQAAAAGLFRIGYEWWAALAVIRLLDPDESYQVDFDADYNLILTEMKEICFGRQAHHPTMRIPEFVIHSRKIDRYVAVKMALTLELDSFVVTIRPPVRPRKKTGDTSLALDSRVMLLSFMESKKKIPIIADIYECTLNSPDWMIECITGREFRDPGAMNEVKHHNGSLKPKLGTSLVLIDPEDDSVLNDMPENIHPLVAGFDQSKLLAAIDELQQKTI